MRVEADHDCGADARKYIGISCSQTMPTSVSNQGMQIHMQKSRCQLVLSAIAFTAVLGTASSKKVATSGQQIREITLMDYVV